jgi:tRNA-specific 2-thiouridylase
MNKKIKVAVGMSGGVDSSVSALLLKQAGYDVIGLFMKLWHDDSCAIERENSCCDEKAQADAQRVADQIGIPLYFIDARKAFKESVTDYFIDEYKHFRTPNPCVVCNKKIKFGWMLDFAKKLDCDLVATGHYCRLAEDKDKKIHLLRGKDSKKDQSYFLYQLNQDQLSHIIFPVGEMTKEEVRGIAKKNNLPVYEKKESQEVCFIAEADYRKFLKRHLPKECFKCGKIVDVDGRKVGEHDGLIGYTIGQRKGIAQDTKGAETRKPLYALDVDCLQNQLIVGEDADLSKDSFAVTDFNFINDFDDKGDLSVKVRYGAMAIPCQIKLDNGEIQVQTAEKIRAITPGQSAVFYRDDEVVGGGIIQKAD